MPRALNANAFVSLGTGLLAWLSKATNRPAFESAEAQLCPLAWVPPAPMLPRDVTFTRDVSCTSVRAQDRGGAEHSSVPFKPRTNSVRARAEHCSGRSCPNGPRGRALPHKVSCVPWTLALPTRSAGREKSEIRDAPAPVPTHELSCALLAPAAQ